MSIIITPVSIANTDMYSVSDDVISLAIKADYLNPAVNFPDTPFICAKMTGTEGSAKTQQLICDAFYPETLELAESSLGLRLSKLLDHCPYVYVAKSSALNTKANWFDTEFEVCQVAKSADALIKTSGASVLRVIDEEEFIFTRLILTFHENEIEMRLAATEADQLNTYVDEILADDNKIVLFELF